MKKSLLVLLLIIVGAVQMGCNNGELIYDDPDVKLFVKQLKAGTYQTKSPQGYVEVLFYRETYTRIT